jgi:hypothetical protein
MTHPRTIDAIHRSIQSEPIHGHVATLERLERDERNAWNVVRDARITGVAIEEAEAAHSASIEALEAHRENMARIALSAAALVIPGITADIIRRIV